MIITKEARDAGFKAVREYVDRSGYGGFISNDIVNYIVWITLKAAAPHCEPAPAEPKPAPK